MGTLSVRENIQFSANLRLSHKVYDKEARQKKVQEVIKQLGLEACADTKVKMYCFIIICVRPKDILEFLIEILLHLAANLKVFPMLAVT